MGGVPSPITLLAVTHGAVRRVDLPPAIDVLGRRRVSGGAHDQAARHEAERSPPCEVYSSTTNWPTT